MYGKVFDSMFEGTLYGHWQAIVTLQQMLVLCNAEGVVDMTPQAMSARTSIPLEIIIKGIEVLSAPDPYSRTPGEEGRRIALLEAHRPWGWYIVNFAKYQALRSREEKLAADRIRIADKRKSIKNNVVAECRATSQPVANVAYVPESVPEDKTKVKPVAYAPPDWVPEKPWQAFLEMRKKKKVPNTDHAQHLAVLELKRLRDAGYDPGAVLDQSTFRGWHGLFPIKGSPGTEDWKDSVI